MPIVSVAVPLVGTVTVREPVDAPNSPFWLTDTLTDSGELGAGLAVTVNVASPPSVIALPAVMLTAGVMTSGAASLSSMSTVSVDS